jgi:hypothetical protein
MLPRRSSPTAMSKAVIEATVIEARVMGRAQTVTDSRCTGLRLVARPSLDPVWQLSCYNRMGRREKHWLGAYPRVGLEKARQKARELRLKIKGPRSKHHTSDVTLQRLFFLYEDGCATSHSWARTRDSVFYVLRYYIGRAWVGIDWEKLQQHVDRYPCPGNMRMVVYAVNKVVAWAEECGFIEKLMKRLVSPRPRRSVLRGSPPRHRQSLVRHFDPPAPRQGTSTANG